MGKIYTCIISLLVALSFTILASEGGGGGGGGGDGAVAEVVPSENLFTLCTDPVVIELLMKASSEERERIFRGDRRARAERMVEWLKGLSFFKEHGAAGGVEAVEGLTRTKLRRSSIFIESDMGRASRDNFACLPGVRSCLAIFFFPTNPEDRTLFAWHLYELDRYSLVDGLEYEGAKKCSMFEDLCQGHKKRHFFSKSPKIVIKRKREKYQGRLKRKLAYWKRITAGIEGTTVIVGNGDSVEEFSKVSGLSGSNTFVFQFPFVSNLIIPSLNVYYSPEDNAVFCDAAQVGSSNFLSSPGRVKIPLKDLRYLRYARSLATLKCYVQFTDFMKKAREKYGQELDSQKMLIFIALVACSSPQ